MAKKDIRTQVKEEFPEFYNEINDTCKDRASLTTRLADLAKGREETQDAKDADEELKEAQTTASGLTAPYRDAQKAIRLKSKFIIATMKDRGYK